jgi:hypothetical protein
MPYEERALLVDIERRLADKYADLPTDHIAAAVRNAYAPFRCSRIRGFLSLLVERRADKELSGLTTDLAPVAFADLGVAGAETIAI